MLALFPGFKLAFVDATRIAREEMGVPITNTVMIGSLIKATNIVDIGSLETPIKDRFGVIAQKNINAYMRAYKETVVIESQRLLDTLMSERPLTR